MIQNHHSSFEDNIVENLDDYTKQLDPHTVASLQRARNNVLAVYRQSTTQTTWSSWPGVAGLIAVAVLLAVSLHRQEASSVTTPFLDDLDLLATEDPEFYQQLEVLQWMDANDVETDT